MRLSHRSLYEDTVLGAIDNAGDILRVLTSFHQSQLDICRRLEELADGLPKNFNKAQALHIIRHMVPLLKRAHHFEETYVFNLFSGKAEHFPIPQKSIDRMKFEHWEDELYAEDLAEALHDYINNEKGETASKLSYMLRGFFDNLRRHIAFVEEFIVPFLLEGFGEVVTAH